MSAKTTRQAESEASNGAALFAPFSYNLIGAHAALAGFDASMQALEAWRRLFDAGRDMIRAQQDATLDMIRAQLAVSDRQDSATAGAAAPFVAPMLAVAKAYEQVGGAVLQAQRTAFSSFTGETAH